MAEDLNFKNTAQDEASPTLDKVQAKTEALEKEAVVVPVTVEEGPALTEAEKLKA